MGSDSSLETVDIFYYNVRKLCKMIIEQENTKWLSYIQDVPVGQCFYYADALYLRINSFEKDLYDKAIVVDLTSNNLKVFPFNIRVTPVTTKLVVEDILNSSLKLLKFDKKDNKDS